MLHLQRALKFLRTEGHRYAVPFFAFRTWVKLKVRRHALKKASPGRKIVVINLLMHMGDIVACEPVSRFVREQHPGAYIIWTVSRAYEPLVSGNPNIDETVVLRCLTEWIHLSKTGLFDEIIDLHLENRVCPGCNKPLKKKIKTEVTLENYYSFGSLLSAFCKGAGLPQLHWSPSVYIGRDAVERVNDICLPQKYVVVHCTSNELCRDWPKENWHDLVRRLLTKAGMGVVEVGLERVLLDVDHPNYYSLCGKLSILETAEVIKRARLFVGIDSGPAHLANAVKTYGVVLLGHYRGFTRPTVYSGGYQDGSNATVIYANGAVTGLLVDDVYNSVVDAIDKQRIRDESHSFLPPTVPPHS